MAEGFSASYVKYLETDLKKIFTENDWIEVPFHRD